MKTQAKISRAGQIITQGKDNNSFWFIDDLSKWITASKRDYNKAWKDRGIAREKAKAKRNEL